MIVIYTFPGTRGIRVTWAVEELQLPYRIEIIDLKRGEHLQDSFLEINSEGKIPAIEIDDFSMSESGAILTFLGDKHGKLVPQSGSEERARYEQLMSFILTELEQPLWTMAKHSFALPKKYQVSDIMPTASFEFQKALAIFSKLIGNSEYLLPSGFSMVDIVAAQTLAWARGAKQVIEDDKINDYSQRMLSRDALIKAKVHEQTAMDNRSNA